MPQAPLPLSGWFVVSLRPVGQHAAVRRAALELGAATISLPGLRLRSREDAPARRSLADALDCERVVFTSPAAVRSATPLQSRGTSRKSGTPERVALAKSALTRSTVLAVGRGTAAALRRAGVDAVITPADETSEGLLALPALRHVAGVPIGLVTAPGGRGLLASTLTARGADLRIAEVYTRDPARLTQRHIDALLEATGSGAVLLSSAEALTNVLAALPDAARTRLFDCTVVASSERLAAVARDTGFKRIAMAPSAQPREMLAALVAHAKSRRFR
jgi:uroporphyrinogen-III synthase